MVPTQTKNKFLYVAPNPPAAAPRPAFDKLYQSKYEQLSVDTTSVLCPTSQLLFSPQSSESLLISGFARSISLENSQGKHKLQLLLKPEHYGASDLPGEEEELPKYVEVTCTVDEVNYIYEKAL